MSNYSKAARAATASWATAAPSARGQCEGSPKRKRRAELFYEVVELIRFLRVRHAAMNAATSLRKRSRCVNTSPCGAPS
jgi:hypothetical protein